MKCYVAESVAKVATHDNSITAMTVSQIFSSIKICCCQFGHCFSQTEPKQKWPKFRRTESSAELSDNKRITQICHKK